MAFSFTSSDGLKPSSNVHVVGCLCPVCEFIRHTDIMLTLMAARRVNFSDSLLHDQARHEFDVATGRAKPRHRRPDVWRFVALPAKGH